MSSSADLTFVHLSDIHFRKDRVGTKHDFDCELRDALTADLRKLATRFGAISGIIVTGDIAWGGHKREYEFADSWLRQVAGHVQCPISNVMVTPGNHDVYRRELEKNGRRIARLQATLRKGGRVDACVERLNNALSSTDGKHLIASLRAYNKFARHFGCDVTPALPFWERPFELGDGTTLFIRGITSTWLSGPLDSEKTANLLYGTAQYTFEKREHRYYLVAGHHPPQNMMDGTEASRSFDFHCKLQLFGHKHDQWLTASRTGARIVAGALHPDRREKPWIPRYNIFEVSGELTDKTRLVRLRVYPRRWSEEFRQFMADFTPEAQDVRQLEFFAV